MKFKIIVSFILFCFFSMFLFSQQPKTAESFVTLLEMHDYWKRASAKNGDAMPPTPLAELQSTNPILNNLTDYSRIHLDYGNQGRERDPMHDFTILEMQFKNREDIPFINKNTLQRYPCCVGSLMFETEMTDSEKTQVFPLWLYKALEHGQVMNWKHREYIAWYGIRYDHTVFIIYTIPTAWMDSVPEYADMLHQYLSADTPDKLNRFIQKLKESRSQSPIAYEHVQDLQAMLVDLGFDPGPVDGKYGRKTENALAGLLFQLGYLKSPEAELKDIHLALKEFQSKHSLSETGRCDKASIAVLQRTYLDLN